MIPGVAEVAASEADWSAAAPFSYDVEIFASSLSVRVYKVSSFISSPQCFKSHQNMPLSLNVCALSQRNVCGCCAWFLGRATNDTSGIFTHSWVVPPTYASCDRKNDRKSGPTNVAWQKPIHRRVARNACPFATEPLPRSFTTGQGNRPDYQTGLKHDCRRSQSLLALTRQRPSLV